MKNVLASFLVLALAGCTAVVSDLNAFGNYADACDPRGAQHLGDDLEIDFLNTNAHINQDMRFAVEVGSDRVIEALFIVSAFDDPNTVLEIPEIMPSQPATLAFWADSNASGVFDPIPMPGAMGTPDHQWFRPICPDGHMTFTHTTPFQDIAMARSDGLIWQFEVPMALQRHELWDTFHIAAWAVRVDMQGRQTRAYYQWQPFVELGGMTPMQRTPPLSLRVGGNVAGETRGAIDAGEMYEVNFVIDVDRDGHMGSPGDYACQWQDVMGSANTPTADTWEFTPPGTNPLAACDVPSGFDPLTFTP